MSFGGWKFVLLVALAFGGASCKSLQVEAMRTDEFKKAVEEKGDGAARSVPGIPFYVKRIEWTQKTEYEVDDYVLVATSAAHKAEPMRLRALAPSASLAAALDAIDGTSQTATELAAVRKLIEGDKRWGVLLSNRVDAVSVVDDTTTYFINAVRPLIGSSSLDVELSPDQTLTKAKTSSDDKTIPSLVDAAKSALGVLGGSPSASERAATGDYAVKVSRARRRLVLSKTASASKIGPPIPLAALETAEVGFELAEPGGASAQSAGGFDVKGTVTPTTK